MHEGTIAKFGELQPRRGAILRPAAMWKALGDSILEEIIARFITNATRELVAISLSP